MAPEPLHGLRQPGAVGALAAEQHVEERYVPVDGLERPQESLHGLRRLVGNHLETIEPRGQKLLEGLDFGQQSVTVTAGCETRPCQDEVVDP